MIKDVLYQWYNGESYAHCIVTRSRNYFQYIVFPENSSYADIKRIIWSRFASSV